MRLALVSLLGFVLLTACQERQASFIGHYTLQLEGLSRYSAGELEVVGEPGDYFGRLHFTGERERTFALGLEYGNADSLAFRLPGGGYLRLARDSKQWQGQFKYFRLRAQITGVKDGPPSPALLALVSLKPLFVGGINTSAEEAFPSFDFQQQTLYFNREGQIFLSQLRNGQWDEPALVPFFSGFNDTAPALSPDGSRLLFTSNRECHPSDLRKKNLWVAERTSNGWGAAYCLPEPVNIDSLGDYHGSIASSGRYYFVSYQRPGGYGRSDLYLAEEDPQTKTFSVQNLGPAINTENSEADVFIDPDERYLLFASTDREDSYGLDDIYISRNQVEGWSKPENLGPLVNSFAYEYGAWVDAKSGFLYFNSYRRGTSDIYRMPLRDVEPLRHLLLKTP
ncbi:MAG: hypothetical protein AAFN81_00275 [Bacteroidota bacterium]